MKWILTILGLLSINTVRAQLYLFPSAGIDASICSPGDYYRLTTTYSFADRIAVAPSLAFEVLLPVNKFYGLGCEMRYAFKRRIVGEVERWLGDDVNVPIGYQFSNVDFLVKNYLFVTKRFHLHGGVGYQTQFVHGIGELYGVDNSLTKSGNYAVNVGLSVMIKKFRLQLDYSHPVYLNDVSIENDIGRHSIGFHVSYTVRVIEKLRLNRNVECPVF